MAPYKPKNGVNDVHSPTSILKQHMGVLCRKMKIIVRSVANMVLHLYTISFNELQLVNIVADCGR